MAELKTRLHATLSSLYSPELQFNLKTIPVLLVQESVASIKGVNIHRNTALSECLIETSPMMMMTSLALCARVIGDRLLAAISAHLHVLAGGATAAARTAALAFTRCLGTRRRFYA